MKRRRRGGGATEPCARTVTLRRSWNSDRDSVCRAPPLVYFGGRSVN